MVNDYVIDDENHRSLKIFLAGVEMEMLGWGQVGRCLVLIERIVESLVLNVELAGGNLRNLLWFAELEVALHVASLHESHIHVVLSVLFFVSLA